MLKRTFYLGKGILFFSESIETIVINKAFAPQEQMLYLSQLFQNVGFIDVLKYSYGKEWVKGGYPNLPYSGQFKITVPHVSDYKSSLFHILLKVNILRLHNLTVIVLRFKLDLCN
jgi:hypothetical protein